MYGCGDHVVRHSVAGVGMSFGIQMHYSKGLIRCVCRQWCGPVPPRCKHWAFKLPEAQHALLSLCFATTVVDLYYIMICVPTYEHS